MSTTLLMWTYHVSCVFSFDAVTLTHYSIHIVSNWLDVLVVESVLIFQSACHSGSTHDPAVTHSESTHDPSGHTYPAMKLCIFRYFLGFLIYQGEAFHILSSFTFCSQIEHFEFLMVFYPEGYATETLSIPLAEWIISSCIACIRIFSCNFTQIIAVDV